jgi:hypothetical protein
MFWACRSLNIFDVSTPKPPLRKRPRSTGNPSVPQDIDFRNLSAEKLAGFISCPNFSKISRLTRQGYRMSERPVNGVILRGLNLPRFDAAPLIEFIATKETDFRNGTDGRISQGCPRGLC